MFGPNNIPEIHHRESAFEELYAETKQNFLKLAKLDPLLWDVFFITGSGTCAIETMLYSLSDDVSISSMGHFSDRAMAYLKENNKYATTSKNVYKVIYETAASEYNNKSEVTVGDCVSSFPYYKPQGDIWATVSSKQLGCSPGLSVVCVKKDLWYTGRLNPANGSYMSLGKYKIKDLINQTPHTPAIGLLREFNTKLATFDVGSHKAMIDSRREEIIKHIPKEFIIGEGPVVTIKNVHYTTEQLMSELDLYNNSSTGPQIFLWSGTDEQYKKLYSTLERIYKKDVT